jgi:flagella basal body P-ring formation protein FlgA
MTPTRRILEPVTIVFTLALLAPGSFAGNADLEATTTIAAAARDYLLGIPREDAGEVDVQVGRLDPRLRLTRCEQPLEVFPAGHARAVGAVTVGVRCDGTRPWKVYLQARVRLFRPVAVLARALPRGARIASADLRLERRDVGRLQRGYLTALDELVGMQLRFAGASGRVLAARDLQAPKLVRRGERVTLLATGTAVEVRSNGRALEDGARGEVIRVRNLDSRRVVEGVVAAAGTVRIRL